MGARQSKRPSRPPRPRAHVRFDDFEILRAIGRGAFGKVCSSFDFYIPQWISLLYGRVQKIEQIKPDHCDRYQNNCTKNAIEWHWSPTSEMVGTLVKFH